MNTKATVAVLLMMCGAAAVPASHGQTIPKSSSHNIHFECTVVDKAGAQLKIKHPNGAIKWSDYNIMASSQAEAAEHSLKLAREEFGDAAAKAICIYA